MQEWLFFTLYGLLMFTAGFLAVFWGNMAAGRFRQLRYPGLIRADRYFFLCLALALNGFGSFILFSGRLWHSWKYGLVEIHYGTGGLVIAGGLALVLLAKAAMVWLADLDEPTHRWLWGMGGITILWSIFSLYLTGAV